MTTGRINQVALFSSLLLRIALKRRNKEEKLKHREMYIVADLLFSSFLLFSMGIPTQKKLLA